MSHIRSSGSWVECDLYDKLAYNEVWYKEAWISGTYLKSLIVCFVFELT